MGCYLPKPGRRCAGLRAAGLALLLVSACPGGHCAWAVEVSGGDEPPVRDAVVEVDAEVNTWLTRAITAMRAGSPETALPLLMRALQTDPTAMASTNGVTYQPVRKLAIKMIRTLPERIVAAYRMRADISTRGLVDRSTPSLDFATLEASYRTGLPDAAATEAGLRLAGLYIDRERFAEARRVLLDLLAGSLDARAPSVELLARLALACARVGDTAMAEWAWAELRKAGGTNRWAGLDAEIRAAAANAAAPATNAWPMAYGGPLRAGASPGGCPDRVAEEGWAMRWGLYLGPGVIRGGPPAEVRTNLPSQFAVGRSYAAACMAEKLRRPADEPIFAGNRAWVNGIDELALVDLVSGRFGPRTPHIVDGPPNSGNAFVINFNLGFGGRAQSAGPAESWLFGYRLNRAASQIGNRVYCVEENHQASLDPNMRQQNVQINGKWMTRPAPIGNALTAYDAGSGRRLWRIGRELLPEPTPAVPLTNDVVWDIPFVDVIAVDGNLADWRGQGRDIPLTPDPGDGNQKWPGATVGLAWNSTGLLVRANVIDADIQEHDSVSNLFQGDSIELFVANRRGGADSIQVAAGTGADPRFRPCRVFTYDRRTTISGGDPEAIVAGMPAARGYTFEALLPWSNLGIRPRRGVEAAVQIYVNNTASNRPALAARFYPQGGTFADTRIMYTVRLADADRIAPVPEPRQALAPEPRCWLANAIRFAAAPVPCAGLLLAPVEEATSLLVVALDANSGALVWKTRLAFSRMFAQPRAMPVTVTVEGTTAYLCGADRSVSALDGCDGSVLWTAIPEMFDDFSSTNASASDAGSRDAGNRGAAATTSDAEAKDVWEEGLVQVAGETVVAMPEDSQEILAFNRWNGTRLWTQRKPEGVEYVLGRRGSSLLTAGRRAVACVSLEDGRTLWRTPIAGSTGRGTLCEETVLIPCGYSIVRLRAEDGRMLGAERVQTMDKLPLGNLYGNGDQLLVAGPERLYALVGTRQELARLTERIARQPEADVYAERGRLYAGFGRYQEALADLREASNRLKGSQREEAARGTLLATLWSAAEQEAVVAEKFHAEATAIATSAVERAQANWRLAQSRERAGDTNGAMPLYVAMLAAPDVTLAPTLGGEDWEVSAHQLAGQRIRVLPAGDAVGARVLLEEPAAQALARLGPAPAGTALVEVATAFPGTIVGRDAAILAAKLATDRGDLGIAEAILQRGLALSVPANRVAVAVELARLYERMKWNRGLTQLCDAWPQLTAGSPVPEFLSQAVASLVPNPATKPIPPWRLRWRKTLAQGVQVLPVPAGLFYWQHSKRVGCLSLETGTPRWEKELKLTTHWIRQGGQGQENDNHLAYALTDSGGICMDLWSGTILTNRSDRNRQDDRIRRGRSTSGQFMCDVNRIGLVTVSPGEMLAVTDILTGRDLWRRCDLDVLVDAGANFYPAASSAAGIILTAYRQSGMLMAARLDAWTGLLLDRYQQDMRKGMATRGLTPPTDPFQALRPEGPSAPERAPAVVENQRLVVKNARTDAVIWTSPADIVIAKHQIVNNDIVVAQTDKDEILLFDSKNGIIRSRTRGDEGGFTYAGGLGDAIAIHQRSTPGTNQMLVLDSVRGSVEFRGRLSAQSQPLLALGPTITNQLLVVTHSNRRVKDQNYSQRFVYVANEDGEIASGLRLPRNEELGNLDRHFYYNPIILKDAILLWENNSGELLAYEHDTGNGGKKP